MVMSMKKFKCFLFFNLCFFIVLINIKATTCSETKKYVGNYDSDLTCVYYYLDDDADMRLLRVIKRMNGDVLAKASSDYEFNGFNEKWFQLLILDKANSKGRVQTVFEPADFDSDKSILEGGCPKYATLSRWGGKTVKVFNSLAEAQKDQDEVYFLKTNLSRQNSICSKTYNRMEGEMQVSLTYGKETETKTRTEKFDIYLEKLGSGIGISIDGDYSSMVHDHLNHSVYPDVWTYKVGPDLSESQGAGWVDNKDNYRMCIFANSEEFCTFSWWIDSKGEKYNTLAIQHKQELSFNESFKLSYYITINYNELVNIINNKAKAYFCTSDISVDFYEFPIVQDVLMADAYYYITDKKEAPEGIKYTSCQELKLTTPEGLVDKEQDDIGVDCAFILGSEGIEFINKLYGYVKIAAAVILLGLSTYDFFIAIPKDDAEATKGAFKRLKTRIIIVIILFLVPIVINVVFSLLQEIGLFTEYNSACSIK